MEKGVDVNKAAYDGWTPLHAAARFGLADVVSCLVRHGGSRPNSEKQHGSTPHRPGFLRHNQSDPQCIAMRHDDEIPLICAQQGSKARYDRLLSSFGMRLDCRLAILCAGNCIHIEKGKAVQGSIIFLSL